MSEPSRAGTWRGTPVAPGVAYGPARWARTKGDGAAAAASVDTELTVDAAITAYDAATAAVAQGLARRAAETSDAAAQVLSTLALLARDPGLRAAVHAHLRGGADLPASVSAACAAFAAELADAGATTAERVSDLRDVERRILAGVRGEPEPWLRLPGAAVILVAQDLAPSDAATLDPDLVLGLVTERGGPTSHTSIIVRQRGIPCVAGVGRLQVDDGSPLLVNGTTGEVDATGDAARAHRVTTADRAARAVLPLSRGIGETPGGARVRILANVTDPVSARAAAAAPVEGIGLFRTELCFLNRPDEPSIEEQTTVYAAVLQPFAGRQVVIRTLDGGSDKPLAFAASPDERNPALGVRGVRLTTRHPGLLGRQLDSIAAAARQTGTEPWVMAPMIATEAEAAGFARAVRERGLRPGAMVEVPAAALLADRLLEVVDFLSVGTNDLAQHAMAADRTLAELSALNDPWQPAVLRLVAMTAAAGMRADKPVGVCGEAAADPLLACVLVGLGVTSLSMSTTAAGQMATQLGAVSGDLLARSAEAALSARDPAAARDAVRRTLGL